MAELLTTKQLQDLLHVDRTTIYRMADSGRLPGLKVGNQWRFPRDQIELWLQSNSSGGPLLPAAPSRRAGNGELALHNIQAGELFPLDCVQLIQDSFADILGVMILVTDLEGNLITRPSNACGLFLATETSQAAHKRCLHLWTQLAADPSLTPRFLKSHLGLLCARGLVRVGPEIKAMLVVGGIAPEPWPPGEAELQDIAADLELPLELLRGHVEEVHHLSKAEQEAILPYVQRIADIFAHIANERAELISRLQRIAAITQM